VDAKPHAVAIDVFGTAFAGRERGIFCLELLGGLLEEFAAF
jgi:hypothetical protein